MNPNPGNESDENPAMRRFFSLMAVCGLAVSMIGCESDKPMTEEEELAAILAEEETPEEFQIYSDATLDAVLGDLTPELRSLTDRPVDMEVSTNVRWNNDWRQWWGDWQRTLMFDRNSRLNKRPVP